jgi:hypothetical protein
MSISSESHNMLMVAMPTNPRWFPSQKNRLLGRAPSPTESQIRDRVFLIGNNLKM